MMMETIPMADQDRYTVEQVLEILGVAYPAASLEEFASYPLEDVCLDRPIFYAGRESYCLQLFETFQDYFHFAATREEWLPLARDETNMRELAEFIAARASYCEVGPVRILGRHCLETGIFRELQRSTNWILRRSARIAPDTRLDDVLNDAQGKLLLGRLTVLFRGDREPNLHRSSPLSIAAWVCFALVLALAALGGLPFTLGIYWGVDLFAAIGGIFMAFSLYLIPVFIVLGIAAVIAGIGKGPFHKNIKTYRDLVYALKGAERWSWAG